MARTAEEVRQMLPIYQAFAEGRTIQWRPSQSSAWRDIRANAALSFDELHPSLWRVKPEEKVTYHIVYTDGSMSSGFTVRLELERRKERERGCDYHSTVKITKVDDKHVSIETVE